MPKYSVSDRDQKDSDYSYTNPSFKYCGEDDFTSEHIGEAVVTESEVKTSHKRKNGKTEKPRPKLLRIRDLLRYAARRDKLLLTTGLITGFLQGILLPVAMISYGDMITVFIETAKVFDNLDAWLPIWQETCLNVTTNVSCVNITSTAIVNNPHPVKQLLSFCNDLGYPAGCEFVDALKVFADKPTSKETRRFTSIFAIFGCAVVVLQYIQLLCWELFSFRICHQIRKKAFWSILQQDIAWFDTHNIGELHTRLSDDIMKVEAGIGSKLGFALQMTSTFLFSICVALYLCWKLALVAIATMPLTIITGMITARIGTMMTQKQLRAYAKAGAIAEEVFGAIQTVKAFGGEESECRRYNSNLTEARKLGIKKGVYTALSTGMTVFVMNSVNSLAYWYGSQLIFNEEIKYGVLFAVTANLRIGIFNLTIAIPNLEYFATARGAAYEVFNIIDSKPHTDSSSLSGQKKGRIVGNVEFRNVSFNYPSRPDVKILKDLSMKIDAGQRVALVGPSGSGKSTIVQLLQRFYGPDHGQILMDGTDIREYDIKWFRQQIGVVSQEPVLFFRTIAENVKLGKEDITDDDIVKACKEANAHDFIQALPDKYNTLVGDRGAQLSGGQKQRIAIARALVKDPKILLLDEATSALDTESERVVQDALDKARSGRTTVVIAHRLSTIRNADAIVVIEDGVVKEQGTHDSLIKEKGLYYELTISQETGNHCDEGDKSDLSEQELNKTLPRTSPRIRRKLENTGTSALNVELYEEEEETEEELKTSLRRIIQLKPALMPMLVLGCLLAMIVGAIQPMTAILVSEMMRAYSETGEEPKHDINFYSAMFMVVAATAAVSNTLLNVTFAWTGESLTMLLRQLAFKSIIKQDVAFFDDQSNSVGVLSTRLATDASSVKGAVGTPLSTFFRSVAGIGVGFVIGFVYSWELSLLLLIVAPLIFIGSYFRSKQRSHVGGQKSTEKAGQVVIETTGNIRTVAALTREQAFFDEYSALISKEYQMKKRGLHVQGIVSGFSNAMMFFAFAACFSLGGYLVENGRLQFYNLFRVFSAIVFSALQLGQATSFAPDYMTARVSAARIFKLIDHRPAVECSLTGGKNLDECSGSVHLRDVSFAYQSRPDVAVLRGFELKLNQGKTVALVGPSGCGKSTILQLIERFYDPLKGCVAVDEHDIRELNLQWLRRQIGTVSQEPVLFAVSIRDNIAYGDNSGEVPMAAIIEAARNANIHSFIEQLPQGYETNVGDKGSQLSGGQKQRIAIARALVRNPKILLLDEATSALDHDNEKVVQAALEKAQEGRTSIIVAHRLSTVQHANCIMVMRHGHIVEKGTHAELLKQRGEYYKLISSQSSNR